jgi:hypothetical protein
MGKARHRGHPKTNNNNQRKVQNMTLKQLRPAIGAAAALAATALTLTTTITAPRVHADSSSTDSRIQVGFNLAPVKLNMKGLNPALVGVGSYIVNAQADCNGCHNSPDLGGEWAVGGNPYFGQPKMENAAGYLGGGSTFGPFPGKGIGGVGLLTVYSRNLTPDSSGLPEGGHTLQEFMTILRTGHDFDAAHPACSTGMLGAEGCIASPPPFAADHLQVMPWPVYGNMSDNDITAIYEYLRAIPCISHAGTIGLPSNLYQTCPAP